MGKQVCRRAHRESTNYRGASNNGASCINDGRRRQGVCALPVNPQFIKRMANKLGAKQRKPLIKNRANEPQRAEPNQQTVGEKHSCSKVHCVKLSFKALGNRL